MADPGLAARGAYHRIIAPGRHGNLGVEPGVFAAPRDRLGLASVIARSGQLESLAAKIETLFGIALPPGPRRIARGAVAFIGVAPHQWLAIEEGGAADFAVDLAEDLRGLASVSDQSDGRAIIRIWGPRARAVLAKGLPIDLHSACFGPGDAAASSIALIGAQLWQIDDRPCYEIAVFRSMAASFAEWLSVSAAEYGIEFSTII